MRILIYFGLARIFIFLYFTCRAVGASYLKCFFCYSKERVVYNMYLITVLDSAPPPPPSTSQMAQGFTAAPTPYGCAFHPQEVLFFDEGTQGRGFGGGAFPVQPHLKASGEEALKLVW